MAILRMSGKRKEKVRDREKRTEIKTGTERQREIMIRCINAQCTNIGETH